MVQDSASRCRLGSLVIVEREVYPTLARATRRTESGVKHAIADLGGALAGPWRAEEKTAAAAAWLVLARRVRPSRR